MTAAETRGFRSPLLDRLSDGSLSTRCLVVEPDQPALDANSISDIALLRAMSLLGCRSQRGLVLEAGKKRVYFEHFPRKKRIEEWNETELPAMGAASSNCVLGSLASLRFEDFSSTSVAGLKWTMRDQKEAIVRDLIRLLETTHLESNVDLQPFKYVRSSVINFGVPSIVGLLMAGASEVELGMAVQKAVRCFEPRLVPESVQVNCMSDFSEAESKGLIFRIEAKLQGGSSNERLSVVTQFDLGAQRFSLAEVAVAP